MIRRPPRSTLFPSRRSSDLPLVCTAFNADFDGDQMAVHIPLSPEAQSEASVLMLSSNNILSPANGQPIAVPSQDIVLGCYYLTKEKKNSKGEGRAFASMNAAVGRVILNDHLPKGLPFVNGMLRKKGLQALVQYGYLRFGLEKTVEMLDAIKDLGFTYATPAGLSIGIDDLVIAELKD